jgi:hypothetical protein
MRAQRRRITGWTALALAAIVAVAVLTAVLTTSRPGGRMDPGATSPSGARALVTLLREAGVDIVVADTVEDVEKAARGDTLVLVAESGYLPADQLRRLAAVPGDRLVLEPPARAREALAGLIRTDDGGRPGGKPDCTLREANRAGIVRLDGAATYLGVDGTEITRCYGGALVRYRDDSRTVTVVGSADFMTNGGLLTQGNAALAMNLAGTSPRLVWFAPQRVPAGAGGQATIGELIPTWVGWVVIQLVVTVALLAWWRGRRLGPLVAEPLPVVVRASETVEGRARLYRSHRARDRAAAALRTAALHRITPRLGLGPNPAAAAVTSALARRCGTDPARARAILFGADPRTDDELLALAAALDEIERKVHTS